MRFPLLLPLLLSLTIGCGPKNPGSVAATAAQASAPVPVDPVYFSTGSSKLASDDDYTRIQQAADQLKGNPRLYVVLTGFTDAGGRVESNLALSQSRAEYVADLLKAAGCDDRRIYAKGIGEVAATSENAQRDRRVEFVFYGAASGELPTVDQILQAADTIHKTAAGETASTASIPSTEASSDTPTDTSKSSKSTKSSKSKAKEERKSMEKIGIADLDSFFAKGQVLLDKLRNSQDRIATARSSLESLLNIAEGASLDSALAELKTSAAGAISVKMEGTKPKVSVKPGTPPTVTEAVKSINGLVDALAKASVDLATLPKDAMALVTEAKTLPAKVPSMAKDAGLKPTQIPGVLKTTKNNIGLLTSIPTETKDLVDETTATFKLIQQTFAG